MGSPAFSECPHCGTAFIGLPSVRVRLHRAICGFEALLILLAALLVGSGVFLWMGN